MPKPKFGNYLYRFRGVLRGFVSPTLVKGFRPKGLKFELDGYSQILAHEKAWLKLGMHQV